MKKVISSLMALTLFLSIPTSALAAEQPEGIETIVGSTQNSTVSIEDIDRLVEERNQAYLNEDYELANNLTDKLYECGMERITSQELCELTGDDSNSATRSGAKFETVYSTYTKSGKLCQHILELMYMLIHA